MLLGTVTYYRRNGKRLSDFDRDTPWSTAKRSSRLSPRIVVVWECSNGAPEKSYFLNGVEVSASAVPHVSGVGEEVQS